MSSETLAPALYEALLNVPERFIVEIINNRLLTQARLPPRLAHAAMVLGSELAPPFCRGRGGPGGWLMASLPEVHGGAHVLVPDRAAWRRERVLHLADAPYFTVPPDWACEVLSPTTEKIDRAEKLPVYAQWGVQHVWLINPELKTLEVLKLDKASYRLLKTWKDDDQVYAEPFEVFELDLELLWRW